MKGSCEAPSGVDSDQRVLPECQEALAETHDESKSWATSFAGLRLEKRGIYIPIVGQMGPAHRELTRHTLGALGGSSIVLRTRALAFGRI